VTEVLRRAQALRAAQRMQPAGWRPEPQVLQESWLWALPAPPAPPGLRRLEV